MTEMGWSTAAAEWSGGRRTGGSGRGGVQASASFLLGFGLVGG